MVPQDDERITKFGAGRHMAMAHFAVTHVSAAPYFMGIMQYMLKDRVNRAQGSLVRVVGRAGGGAACRQSALPRDEALSRGRAVGAAASGTPCRVQCCVRQSARFKTSRFAKPMRQCTDIRLGGFICRLG